MSTKRPEAPRATWWDALWRRFWTLPAVVAALSLALGLVMPEIDASIETAPAWVFEGGVDGARSVLGTIAGAMISVTGLVFSITMVILQLASSQFTPRILGTFLESRVTQVTLGVFTGSFLYALTVLRAVRGGDDGRVPQFSVTLSYGYVVVAVAMFLAFIHHITTSVQVSQVMTQARLRTVATVHRMTDDAPTHAAGWSPRPDTPSTVLCNGDRQGYVTVIDGAGLIDAARRCEVVVELDLGPGEFVAPGQPVGRAWGRADLAEDDVSTLLAAAHLAEERDHFVDTGFGIRQLLDIAERALSPGINDPTTAIQAVNELHVILRALAVRPDPSPYLRDEGGEVRATYRSQRYADHLGHTVEEIVHYGADTVRVLPHLRTVLADLVDAARPEHRDVTRSALAHVESRLEG